MFKRFIPEGANPVWAKVLSISIIFLFVSLADAMLSFWVPGFMQEKLGSAFLMGIVMSFSSVVGLIADIILPQVVQGSTARKLITLAIIISAIFAGSLLLSISFPIIILFLLAMAVWGIYYEFLGFARQQFIANSTPHNLHASASALIVTFFAIAYTLGPVIAEYLENSGDQNVIYTAFALLVIAFVLVRTLTSRSKTYVNINHKKINILSELSHWRALFKTVWPVVLMSLMIGFIDSAFWTSGTVLSEKLGEGSVWGNFILPAYMLPSLFVVFVLMKLNIKKRKKYLAQLFLFVSGIFLFFAGLVNNTIVLLLAVFVSSMFLAFAHPLIEAVYSDIIERLGRHRWHLIGLSNSSASIAYIIGPIIAGVISSLLGEAKTFSVLGVATVALAFILLVVTPKKLHLPKKELNKWKE